MILPGDMTLAEMRFSSLASLDTAAGKPRPDLAALALPASWPLEKWHAKVYDLPFGEYDDENLARLCRQQMGLECATPIAFQRLQGRPFAGELYDGELLMAVGSVSAEYWQMHPEVRQPFYDMLQYVLSLLHTVTDCRSYDIAGPENADVRIYPRERQQIADLQLRLLREA